MRTFIKCWLVENICRMKLTFSLAFLFSLVLCGASAVRAQSVGIAIDNKAVKGDFSNVGLTGTSLTNYTVGAGNNRVLVVGISTSYGLPSLPNILPAIPPTNRVTDVRYNGTSMTRILTKVSSDNLNSVEMFRLTLANSASSTTANIDVDLAGVSYVVVGAISFTGVNQTTPVRTSNSASGNGGTTPGVTVTSQAGDVVLDTVATQPSGGFLALPLNSSQTEQWNGSTQFSSFSVGAGSTKSGAPSVAMTWQSVSQPWAIGAISLQPASATSSIVISEFRTRGPNGASDEFVEIYNRTTSSISIGGFRIRGSGNTGSVSDRVVITAGTTLSPGCHYLVANNTATTGYSGSTTPNQTYTSGIVDDGGIAITMSDGTTIIDAVGMSSGSAYKEGTTLTPLSGTTNQSYERKPGGSAGSSVDTNDNSADFTLKNPSDPQNQASTCVSATFATLTNFTATKTGQGVLLKWETSYEVNNLGFNIYREDAGKRVLVNPSLIAGTAFLAGAGTQLTAGYSYQWLDPQGTADSIYTLEDIDLDGTHTMHGPVAPVADSASSKASGQAQLLNQLSANASSGGSQVTVQGSPAYFSKAQSSFASSSAASTGDAPSNTLASQSGVKLSVSKDGWYHADLAELVAAGLNAKTNPLKLQLYADGVEQAISVFNKSARIDGGGYIEFYGTGLDTPATDTRTYWLVSGTKPGKRIVTFNTQMENVTAPKPIIQIVPQQTTRTRAAGWINIPFITIFPDTPKEAEPSSSAKESDAGKTIAAPPPAPLVAPVAAEPAAKPEPKPARKKKRSSRKARKVDSNRQKNHPTASATATPVSYAYTVERRERTIYFSALQNGDAENFFGQILASTPVEQAINIRNLDTASSDQAQLEVVLQGATTQSHQVLVQLNGTDIGTLNYTGQSNSDTSLSFSPTLLREGDNTVRLITQAGSADVSLVDRLKLTYAHLYRAENDRLNFIANGSSVVNVEGFSTSKIRVLDITNPNEVQEVIPQVKAQGASYTATIESDSANTTRHLVAFGGDRFEHPSAITFNSPSSWSRSTNAADFLIITDRRFSASIKPLAQLRASQGMSVAVVDVEDIFDEFSYGAHSTQAVKDFLSWASTHWQKSPRFVMFVGDGSYDPRNYQGKGKFDLIPTKMMDTRYMETADDDWYADFNDDGVPEMAVGRLPVRTVEEANAVVSKIVGYRPSTDNSGSGVLLVSDKIGPDGFNFESTSNELKPLIPVALNVQTIARHDEDGSTIRAQIINSLNQGPLIANYAGHGTYDKWTGDGVLRTIDASSLANSGKTSLFVTMTCMNGYYVDTTTDSLAEALIKVDNGGAIAVWASSGITLPTGQAEINQKLYQQLFSDQGLTLGEAVQKAKASTSDLDVRRTWIFFGDPTMRIR
jgi:hypothetical protein